MDSFLHDISWVLPLRTPGLTIFFNAFTWLGYPTFFLLFLPIGYWLWNKHWFTRLAILIGVTGILNALIKDYVQDPRPAPQFAIDPRTGDSFGFTSGHAQIAVAMWFWLAYEMKRAWFWVVAFLITLGVCLSRLYLGVHDIEDVLGGLLIGLATIIVYRRLVSNDYKFWHEANPLLQLVVIFAVHPIIWFFWPGPNGPGVAFALLGFIVGWWSGVIIERKRIHFGRPSNWVVAIAASIAAAALFVISYKPLEQILVSFGFGKIGVGWIHSALFGLYATAFVPLLLRNTRVLKTDSARTESHTD